MSLKENVNSVLRAVGLKAVEIKLAQMKADDGVTVFEAESFQSDYSVGISTPEGIVPCPVGEYKLEDGTIMVVEVEGVIAEIKEEAAEEAEPETAHPAAEATEPVAMEEAQTVKKVVESVTKETFFSENILLKVQIEELKAQLEAKNEVKAEVVELAEENEVEPIRFNPENSKTPEVFRYAKGAGQTRLDSIINKLNK